MNHTMTISDVRKKNNERFKRFYERHKEKLCEQKRNEYAELRKLNMTKKRIGIVYLITCLSNGNRYVGQTVRPLEKRWQVHIQRSQNSEYPLYRSIRKHGVDQFKIEPLEVTKEYDYTDRQHLQNELNQLEIKHIQLKRSFVDWNDGGYNLTTGGNCQILSDESIEKIRIAHLGKPLSEEHKQRIRSNSGGWKHTEETKRQISESKKGHKHSLETRKKIGDANRKRQFTET